MRLNRKLKMGMVGGGPGAFIGEVHRKAARMDGQTELSAHLFGFLRVNVKSAGYQLYLAIHAGGLAMHLTDERPGASTDHTHLQLSVEFHTLLLIHCS